MRSWWRWMPCMGEREAFLTLANAVLVIGLLRSGTNRVNNP